jgi:RimJ/RimL family protein N-acetyltransferase
MLINFESIERFETRRLLARRHTESDFDTVLLTYQNELTMQTLGGVVTKEEAAKRIQWNLDCWARDGFGGWLWFHKESGRFIGRAGLRRVDIEGKSVIEVGYVLLSEFWGQGFASEMAAASIEVAFEHLGIKELVSYTAISNNASQRVMEKAGFKFGRNFTHGGEPYVLYQLSLNDYLLTRNQH